MKKVLEFLVKHSGKLCAFAIGVAAIAPECCRETGMNQKSQRDWKKY